MPFDVFPETLASIALAAKPRGSRQRRRPPNLNHTSPSPIRIASCLRASHSRACHGSTSLFGLYYVSAGLRNPPAEAMRFATARTLYVTGKSLLESI
jgi:hypothetical protein